MSGLYFNPGVGDLIDRLFILMRRTREQGLSRESEKEATEIGKELGYQMDDAVAKLVIKVVTLCAVNAVIWQHTDEARDPNQPTVFRDRRASGVLALNVDRRVLVKELNAEGKEEKL